MPYHQPVRLVVAVVIDDGDIAAREQPDGRDIAFTDGDGVAHLAHEIDGYDSGRLTAWLRVRMLEAFGPTKLWVYYGDERSTPWYDVEATWVDAASVWHLREDPREAPVSFGDSGPADNDGFLSRSPGALTSADGIAGSALGFSDGTRVFFSNGPEATLTFADTSFSYMLWINTSVAYAGIPWFHSGTCAPGCPGYSIELFTSWNASVSDGATNPLAAFGQGDAYLDRWVHLAGVVDRVRGELRAYVNGVETGVTDIESLGSLSPNYSATLGNGDQLIGTIDEVRVYPRAVSEAELTAMYNNMMTSVTLGPEEPRGF